MLHTGKSQALFQTLLRGINQGDWHLGPLRRNEGDSQSLRGC